MGLEAATYISDLVATNPLGSDGKDEGDDHLRLIKSVLQATFPNTTQTLNAGWNTDAVVTAISGTLYFQLLNYKVAFVRGRLDITLTAPVVSGSHLLQAAGGVNAAFRPSAVGVNTLIPATAGGMPANALEIVNDGSIQLFITNAGAGPNAFFFSSAYPLS